MTEPWRGVQDAGGSPRTREEADGPQAVPPPGIDRPTLYARLRTAMERWERWGRPRNPDGTEA